MKRTELLNTMRPSKQRKAVEMAMRPNGVTSAEMVAKLGIPFTNRMRAMHVQGVATLVRVGNAYQLVTDERLTADALRAQQQRREAYQRMMADREAWPMTLDDYDDCDD